MRFTRFGSVAAVAVAATLLLSSCAANEEAAPSDETSESASTLSGTFAGSGASSQGSAQEAWVKEFQTANPEVTINYDPAGSGTGRSAFIAGGVAFAGSDSVLSDDELAGEFGSCVPGTGAIDLPVYISPIAVIFNVEGVDALNLDAATIANIFKGEITTWNDAAIVALNPDADLPAATITAVHRSDDSGTTKNFADYLGKVAPEVWDAEAEDAFPYTGGEAAQGTSGVVEAVKNGTNTIGYADASKADGLGVAAIKVGENFVDYTAEAAALVVDASPAVEGREDNDIAIALDRTTTEDGAYPLVLVSYIITCNEYLDETDAQFVKEYIGYVASEQGQADAAEAAGAAPISAELSARVATSIEAIK